MRRGGLVVNATTRPLYPGKKTRCPLYGEFGGTRGRSGRVWEISTSPEFEPRTAEAVASRHTGRSLPYVPPVFDIQKRCLLPTPCNYAFRVDLGTNCDYLYLTNMLLLTVQCAESRNIIRVKLGFQGVKIEVTFNLEFIKPLLYWRNIHILLFSPALFRY